MKKRIFSTVFLAMGLVAAKAQQQDTLSVNRAKINQLDKEIVHLLGQRMEAARAIGIYKQAHNMEVLQSNRFNEVLQKAIEAGKTEGLSEEFIRSLYEAIHKESIRQQEALKKK
ncbi:chorismate mutase [Chitinophaga sp.]|uniref:chorismate mutase n=1 Tax=Chitinophaga sp. TaxID=1869181 RepID=UPI0031DD00AC